MNYNWLLFDADNTLFDFSAAEAASLQDCIEQTDIEWSEEVLGIYREINHEAWVAYENGQLNKSQIRHIRFERLLDRFRCALHLQGSSNLYIARDRDALIRQRSARRARQRF